MRPNIKPIETLYNGYRFRSRLEARWAVFFDALGIKYEYEKEGYDLGELGWYLPDFWLPEHKIWAEVKGEEPTHEEKMKAMTLSSITHQVVLILSGNIGLDKSRNSSYPDPSWETFVFRGIPGDGFDVIDRNLTLEIEWWDYRLESLQQMLYEKMGIWQEYTVGYEKELIDLDKKYYLQRYGKDHPHYLYGRWSKCKCFFEFRGKSLSLDDYCYHSRIAIRAARSARFEHGEKPMLPQAVSR